MSAKFKNRINLHGSKVNLELTDFREGLRAAKPPSKRFNWGSSPLAPNNVHTNAAHYDPISNS